jgi:hypothetical protein
MHGVQQDGHLKVAATEGKKGKTAGWTLPAAGRPPLHKTKDGTQIEITDGRGARL